MKLFFSILILLGACFSQAENKPASKGKSAPKVEAWITSPSTNVLFQKQNESIKANTSSDELPTILVNAGQTFQTIDGFGNSLTGGSALVLNKMDKASRLKLLKELFATDGNNIGISYLRLSIGASDLSDHLFTYDEIPEGQTDVNMDKFSLEPEKKDLIPVLKEILAINPKIKIMGSPWTAPTWMKTNKKYKGGSLKPEYFDAYARYFVKYIQGMKAEGIAIDAITIQNEPLHPGNTPSMFMPAADQADFIRKSLGPAFKAAEIKTKIIVYDHNADRIDYPISILEDPQAAQYVDGSAFHLYGGTIEELSKVHAAHPNKNLYFTEQWVGAPGNLAGDLSWHVRTLIIGGTRNWCRNVLEWNMASDPKYDPHTDDGGCDQCLGAITIDGNHVTRNPAYYILAHAAKSVRPGSVRIDSNLPENLPNVAFKTSGGKLALIVINDAKTAQKFRVKCPNSEFSATLPSGAVGTYIW
jgi:O-Glycosyl hydrolase